MHPATKNGFITGSIYLDDEYAKNFTKENPQQFIDHFKNLISNKDMIGDKTLIILSKEPHHLFKQTIEQSRKKSLDVAAKVSLYLSRNQTSFDLLVFEFLFVTFLLASYRKKAKNY